MAKAMLFTIVSDAVEASDRYSLMPAFLDMLGY